MVKLGHSQQKREKEKCLVPICQQSAQASCRAAHTDLVLKTRGCWIRPWLAKDAEGALLNERLIIREKNFITERHSFPGTCKSLEYDINTALLGIGIKEKGHSH